MAYDQTLVQIRERSFLDILDLSLVVVRQHPVVLGLAAVAGVLPFALVNAWLVHALDEPAALLIPLILFDAPLATAPLTIVLGGLMFGQPPRPIGVLKSLGRSTLRLIIYQVVIRTVCVVTLIPYVFFHTRLTFVNEVILLEQGPWKLLLPRILILTERRGGELFGRSLACLLIGSLFLLTFWHGTGAFISALSRGELTWEPSWRGLAGVRLQVALWLVIAFFAIARFFSYIDQRIRLEGWEVELRLRSAGSALEDAGRW